MKRVYSSESLPLAWHVRNVLQQFDIAAEVRNSQLFSVAGEIPINECQAEVWVPSIYSRRAEQLIKEIESSADELEEDAEGAKHWQCDSCAEQNPDNFAACWNCSSSRKSDSAAGASGSKQ